MINHKIFGLYKTTYTGVSDDYTHLLATSTNPEELVTRWNRMQEAECIEYGYEHNSYFKRISPPMPNLNDLTYNGNTGGGYGYVKHTISIRLVPQWDET